MTAALGRLIAQRRRDLGMSQRELAERLCLETGRPTVTRHELSRYERGVRQPNRTTLAVLATVLDLPITNLSAVANRRP
jgi:transcriptional regulator with XRE-family HTH domain